MYAPYERVALDEVVDDVLSAHRIAAERAGVALEASLPPKPVRVIGSDRALVRVLSNLVANAIAHTPSGGSVKLALGSDENGAWARVDDTGVGIDQADLPQVFDVAYRGSNDRVPRADSSLPSGSGLGLAIAAGLVQAHRGTLSAHNLPTGARFECGYRWPTRPCGRGRPSARWWVWRPAVRVARVRRRRGGAAGGVPTRSRRVQPSRFDGLSQSWGPMVAAASMNMSRATTARSPIERSGLPMSAW